MIDVHDLYMSVQLASGVYMSGVHFFSPFEFIFMYDLGEHALRKKELKRCTLLMFNW